MLVEDKPIVLIIDDGNDIVKYCERFLGEDYSYFHVSNGKEGVEHARKGEVNLVLLDKSFKDIPPDLLLGEPANAANEGLVILKELKRSCPSIPVMMVTSHADYESAREAILLGASDYIEWGAIAVDKLFLKCKIDRAIEQNELKRELLVREYSALGLVGRSKQMIELFEKVDQAADSPITVLLQGESGTGKELAARAMHRKGSRANGPFVKISCANLPEQLLESELFGYEKGAFTHAYTAKRGRFEDAHSGTLFLDEVGDMRVSTQAKLLRAVEEKSFERLGGTKTITTDVRIIAATNKDLAEAVEGKTFREDLYWRLNQLKIRLPPLRSHKEDIPNLVVHFVDKYSRIYDKDVAGISPEGMDHLSGCEFASGNVRELEDLVRASVHTADRVVTLADILKHQKLAGKKPTESVVMAADSSLLVPSLRDATLKDIEKQVILQRLDESDWKVEKVARSLGIGKTKLYQKIKEYGMADRLRGHHP